jgi:hypothetical protein
MADPAGTGPQTPPQAAIRDHENAVRADPRRAAASVIRFPLARNEPGGY